jgi:hypothetical protein
VPKSIPTAGIIVVSFNDIVYLDLIIISIFFSYHLNFFCAFSILDLNFFSLFRISHFFKDLNFPLLFASLSLSSCFNSEFAAEHRRLLYQNRVQLEYSIASRAFSKASTMFRNILETDISQQRCHEKSNKFQNSDK